MIKHISHTDNMPVGGQIFIEGCVKAGFIPLSIENKHVLAVEGLQRKPEAGQHNDPFDRMLIAQAKSESMLLITHDGLLSGYDEECIMKI